MGDVDDREVADLDQSASHRFASHVDNAAQSSRDETLDPEGGDPGGWTTDQVTFTDHSGQTIAVTVGHHYNDTRERTNSQLAVIYDPAHPRTAMSVIDHQDDRSGGSVLDGIALLTVFGSAAVGFLISALRFTVERASTPKRSPAIDPAGHSSRQANSRGDRQS